MASVAAIARRRAERDLIRLQASLEAKAEAAQEEVTARHHAFEVSGATRIVCATCVL